MEMLDYHCCPLTLNGVVSSSAALNCGCIVSLAKHCSCQKLRKIEFSQVTMEVSANRIAATRQVLRNEIIHVGWTVSKHAAYPST